MDLEEQHDHAEEVGHVPSQPEQIHLRHPLLLPFPSLPRIKQRPFLPPSQARLVGEWWWLLPSFLRSARRGGGGREASRLESGEDGEGRE